MMDWNAGATMMQGGGLLGTFWVLWAIIWTVNSVLIGALLWALIQKYGRK